MRRLSPIAHQNRQEIYCPVFDIQFLNLVSKVQPSNIPCTLLENSIKTAFQVKTDPQR
jgi:hypothetical protein